MADPPVVTFNWIHEGYAVLVKDDRVRRWNTCSEFACSNIDATHVAYVCCSLGIDNNGFKVLIRVVLEALPDMFVRRVERDLRPCTT